MASAEKILFNLIPDYDDQLLPFYVEDEHIKEFCENRCFENSDLINLKIAVAGFGAIIEVANLVMGAQEQCRGKLHPVILAQVVAKQSVTDCKIDWQ